MPRWARRRRCRRSSPVARALWAVRGDVDEVSLKAPDQVAVQLVQHLVGALERSRPHELGVDNDGLERVLVNSPGQPDTSAYRKP